MPAKTTVFRWLSENPEFQDQYARAREFQASAWEDDILSIADDEDEDPQSRKIRIDARKWIMAKAAPKKYGDRITSIHEGGDKPIETKDVTLRDTARRIGFVLASAIRQKD